MERFRPLANTPPTSLSGKLKFFGRMIVDLQILTIYRDVRKVLPTFRGQVLDIGCGQSPYKHLLDGARTVYRGIDVIEAAQFDYHNDDIAYFNGEDIPFDDAIFDGVICTEVLEHVEHYQKLIDEMYRVMKKGGRAIITIPWSARYHYVPYDFFRYTPSSLRTMFGQFEEARVHHRGTDIPNIANKVIVLWARNLLPSTAWQWLWLPLWIASLPVLVLVVMVAHLSLWLGLGAADDPLGYTVVVRK